MIRKKQRTAKQRHALKYKQKAAISIGPTRAQRKAQRDAEETAQIAATRILVFERDSACVLCVGKSRINDDATCWPDQMHEHPSRAMSRRMPAAVRFNTRRCVRLCPQCHADVTENRILIEFSDRAKGFNAQVSPFWHPAPIDFSAAAMMTHLMLQDMKAEALAIKRGVDVV